MECSCCTGIMESLCVCSYRSILFPIEFVVDCRKFVDSNALGLTVTALSSYDPQMRAVAYSVLAAYYSHVEGARFREQSQVSGLGGCRSPQGSGMPEAASDKEPKSVSSRGRRQGLPGVPSPREVEGAPLGNAVLVPCGQSRSDFCRLFPCSELGLQQLSSMTQSLKAVP